MKKYWLVSYSARSIGGLSTISCTDVTDKHPADYLQWCINCEERDGRRPTYTDFMLVFAMEIDEETYNKHENKLSA
jgi:hypothetical protein